MTYFAININPNYPESGAIVAPDTYQSIPSGSIIVSQTEFQDQRAGGMLKYKVIGAAILERTENDLIPEQNRTLEISRKLAYSNPLTGSDRELFTVLKNIDQYTTFIEFKSALSGWIEARETIRSSIPYL